MPLTDLPLDELRTYRPSIRLPKDFDAFWDTTLAQARVASWPATRSRVATPLQTVQFEELRFSGYGGESIRAWLITPQNHTGQLPVVVEYVGYNGGRGVPGEKLFWASAGYAHVVMDTRGQGSGWGTGGATPDPHGSDSSFPGFMTRGITDRAEYYYRRVYTDAVMLIDAVRSLDGIDSDRIAVTGASQGGGIAIAAAALSHGVAATLPDVPYLSHFERAVELTAEMPFTEIVRYLAVHRDRIEQVFDTLSYFDGVNFAERISIPAYFSVALMDGIVLPSTVFAAFNHLKSADRAIEVYRFNGHEGGQTVHALRQAEWLAARMP
ncbi:cephalosporin-C deacetylase [Microbacterium halimionae]|uniref:Cephalosporin-C deacetylase n=1 Tax=Microbacterium halimionae TaxID=1526413 RepID=A0A7W3PMP1_9MICO|nr:acetylxylan esterase [Microbacterium halimionae]MBA8817167.1 cephalosporin-C deacetylase [Microbacterium halimionae]NII94617.1 cephalosporin-C deacetylase [Microbacterium halimionae]